MEPADPGHANRRGRAIIALGGLICGFLWEFWNFWAYPKWEYEIPLLGFGKVFEMPILGYGGYVPFAWSVVQTVRPPSSNVTAFVDAQRADDLRESVDNGGPQPLHPHGVKLNNQKTGVPVDDESWKAV